MTQITVVHGMFLWLSLMSIVFSMEHTLSRTSSTRLPSNGLSGQSHVLDLTILLVWGCMDGVTEHKKCGK